mgnify:CR=1 FL=1
MPALLYRTPDRLAKSRRASRPALAKHPRSLPRLAVGDHAPADDGQGRHSILSEVRRALAERRRARRRSA